MHPPLDSEHASSRQWWLVIGSGLVTLVCGTIGGWQYEQALHPDQTHSFSHFLGAAYAAVQMLILHSPHFDANAGICLEVGRWAGAFTLIAAAWVLWQRLRREYRAFRVRYWTGHHVVCGLGQKGFEIIQRIRKDDGAARIVAIDPHPEHALFEQCEALGVYVLAGDATDRHVLETARVAWASEIVAITPDDASNIRIAVEVRAARQGHASEPALCHAHLSDIYLRQTLQMWLDQTADPVTPLRFLDVYDNEARRVLRDPPLDGSGIGRDDPRTVHVVILGFGRMGASLALRAAKMGHFANGRPLRISVIDRDADTLRDRFLFRFPVLGQANSPCRLSFLSHPVDSLSAHRQLEQWAAECDTLLHVFVCLENDAYSVDVGLRLSETLDQRPDLHLLIRVNTAAAMAAIRGAPEPAGVRPIPFGMAREGCLGEAFRWEENEAQARLVHEDFVKARLAEDAQKPADQRRPKDDPAMRRWEGLGDRYRESNRQQADHADIKMRAIGCRIVMAADPRPEVAAFAADEVELLAELEHARWNAERLLGGWRFGETTDKTRRIHNCLVPWDQLPEKIKEYDRQAVRNILNWVQPDRKVIRAAE